MDDPLQVTDARSALARLLQNHADVVTIEREVKRLTDARSVLLMEARQLQELILASGDPDVIGEMRSRLAFRNTTAPKKIPRPVEEKEVFAILRAFRAREPRPREADIVRLAQETYPGRPLQAHQDALKKLLLTAEVTRNPDGSLEIAIPFHLI